MSCTVCTEIYNKSTRKPIQCSACQNICCMQCVKHYLLTSDTPTCTSCNFEWSYEYLLEKLPKMFITTTYKEHAKDILFKRELTYTAETMESVKFIKQYTKNYKDQHEFSQLGRQYHIIFGEDLIYSKIDMAEIKANRLRHNSDTERKNTIIHSIPCITVECKGFLNNYKCAVCEIIICDKCMKAKNDDEHKCKKEDLKSEELVRRETRQCPKCAANIYRIFGCNQMWCTCCKTAFDWETLKIITKNFHNPHYHEYMQNRTNEAVVVVNQCELPEYYLIKKYLTNKNIQFFDMALENIHRANLELSEFITTFQINNYPPALNQWSRIQYILGDISEQKFKDEIYKKDREQKKLIAFRQIYEMFIMVTRDIFHQILVSDSALFDQFISAIEYFNENIELKAKQFNTTSYRKIDINYNLVNN